MKHLKMLGLLAVAATALLALVGVGTASAHPTELYTGHTTANSGLTLHAVLDTGTTALLTDTSGELADTCKESTVNVKTTGKATEEGEIHGEIETLTWGGCTWTTKTLTNGSLDITDIGDVNGDGQGDGTVTGTASRVTVQVFGFLDCVYGTGAGTHLGTLTGSTAGHATMDINATVKLQEGAFCPETTKWVAKYEVTSPTGLNVRT